MTNPLERPVDFAISQIADVKTIETDTVLEAYILEQNLIKKLQPKYNAMGKDDKSFTYAVITKEEFPRILLLRKTEVDQISNSFKIQNSKFKINAVYGPYTSKKQIEIALKILRKIFTYHSNPQKTEKGCLDSQIGLCPGPYDGKISHADYLKNIRGIRMILEGKKKGLVKKLEKEMKIYSKNHEYEKAAEARNKIFVLKHIRDVALITNDNRSLPSVPSGHLPSGRGGGILDTRYQIQNTRIEAYDISNISGQHAVGSMVVFDNENGEFEPNKNEYRKFRIRTIHGADDVGMMREVLLRRFNNNWPKPNLILLDGGIGHLHMAEELLRSFKLDIPLVAVAKDENRKGFTIHGSQPIEMKNILSDRNLVKQIMDEAHRFAIAYHKKVRKREFI
jgi:excinuclease ABC subunit C